MAQTLANNAAAFLQKTHKQQKKQATRVSKLQLEIERIRRDLQKKEQKIARMRVDNEIESARLRTLEEELAKLQENSMSK